MRCSVFDASSIYDPTCALALPAHISSEWPLRRLAVQIGADSVGGNYAIALVELASEADDLEKVHQDMDALASVLAENAEVGMTLEIAVR